MRRAYFSLHGYRYLIRADAVFLPNASGRSAMTSVDELCAVALVVNGWDNRERAESSPPR
ncbi:hypothetical protein ABZ016_10320 [Streptomyces sp. NPDC006372]|uniref:hypothetical protein n=1 Tax=Streptomyces sp. NPDC006372 TaxID=3155599 RepID=UPI0033B8FD43